MNYLVGWGTWLGLHLRPIPKATMAESEWSTWPLTFEGVLRSDSIGNVTCHRAASTLALLLLPPCLRVACRFASLSSAGASRVTDKVAKDFIVEGMAAGDLYRGLC